MDSIAFFMSALWLVVFTLNNDVDAVIIDVQLVGGPSPFEGTVEYTQDGVNWETTCGENLGINDAIIICRQLEHAGVNRPLANSPFNISGIPTTYLLCNGEEASLEQCRVPPIMCKSSAGAVICYDHRYLGCFKDMIAQRILSGDSAINRPDMSIEQCTRFCMDSSIDEYEYAGVENGNECYCGVAGTNFRRYGVGTDSDCQSPCSGSRESCGGSGFIAIFSLRDPTTASTPGETDLTTISGYSTSIQSLPTTRSPTTSSSTKAPLSGDNAGLYAGIGGAAGMIVLIVIIIIVVMFYFRKRNPGKSIHELKTNEMKFASSPDIMENAYDGLHHDVPQNTCNTDHEPSVVVSDSGEMYCSVIDAGNSTTAVKTTDSVTNGDTGGLYAIPDEGNKQTDKTDECDVLCAMSEKRRKESGNSDDIGALYAVPDKNKTQTNAHDVELSALYATPDKPRSDPDGRVESPPDDVYALPDKVRHPYNEGVIDHGTEGLYSMARDPSGLYVVSDGENEPVMIDNELYKL